MSNEIATPAPSKGASALLNADLPKIAISCGDLNGIGLEVILKTLSDKRVAQQCIPILFASKKAVDFYRDRLPEDLRKRSAV